MNEIVIVLINYFKEEDLASFIRSRLLMQTGVSLRIYIVDNGSKVPALLDSLAMENVVVLKPGSNLGYFGAAHFAYEAFLKSNNGRIPEHFVVSNFDLEFDPENFFNHFITIDKNVSAVVSGPAIMSSLSHDALNPIYPTRLTFAHLDRLIFVTSFYPFFYVYQLLHYFKRWMRKNELSESKGVEEVYAVHGSMMFFSQKYFDLGGTLKYDSFLYGEELFVAEQVRRMNLNCVVYHSLKVVHREHSTTGYVKGITHMRYLNHSLKFLKSRFFS